MSTEAELGRSLDVTHSKDSLGFWLYLMTDSLVFGSLFATFMVLRNATAGGPGSRSLFELEFVFVETVLLLASSLACGLALLTAHSGRRRPMLLWLALTGLLGASFLGMELYEFAKLYSEGHSWTQSAFLSAYFTLVGTHGLHILVGLIWLVTMGMYVVKRGITKRAMQQFTMFALFWHFLDIVWICIFTIVYMMGVI